MRRIYDTISETLGHRTLQQETDRDVVQLKLMVHALGYFRPDEVEFPEDDPELSLYTPEAVDAVDRFREDQGWRTTVPGFVDRETVDRLWRELEETGRDEEVREALLEILRVRR